MASHSYEIATWTPSEAARKDPTLVQAAMNVVKTKTPLPIVSGISVEQQDLYLVIAWEKTSTHKEALAAPDYPELAKLFVPLFPEPRQGEMSMVHAHFDRSPLPVLGAPVTAISRLIPKDGVSLEELRATLTRVCDALSKLDSAIFSGAAWASAEERSEELLLVTGWKSKEDHWATVNPGGPGADIVSEMRSKVQMEKVITAHVPFTKHQWV